MLKVILLIPIWILCPQIMSIQNLLLLWTTFNIQIKLLTYRNYVFCNHVKYSQTFWTSVSSNKCAITLSIHPPPPPKKKKKKKNGKNGKKKSYMQQRKRTCLIVVRAPLWWVVPYRFTMLKLNLRDVSISMMTFMMVDEWVISCLKFCRTVNPLQQPKGPLLRWWPLISFV